MQNFLFLKTAYFKTTYFMQNNLF